MNFFHDDAFAAISGDKSALKNLELRSPGEFLPGLPVFKKIIFRIKNSSKLIFYYKIGLMRLFTEKGYN